MTRPRANRAQAPMGWQLGKMREDFASGRAEGISPREMRVLEIACGAVRVIRSLAELFGDGRAVDVSVEMIEGARSALPCFSRVHLYRNDRIVFHIFRTRLGQE